MKKLRSMPFMAQVLAGYIVVALVPLVLYNLLAINLFNSRLKNQAEETAQLQLGEMGKALEELFFACEQAADMLADQPLEDGKPVAWALLDNTNDYTTLVNLALYQAGSGITSGADVSLYDAGGRLRFTTGSGQADVILPLRWGVLQKAQRQEGTVFYNATNSYSMQVAGTLTTVKGYIVGYAVIGLPEDAFRLLLAGAYDESSAVLLLDEAGMPVYSSRQYIPQEQLEAVRGFLLANTGGSFQLGDDVFHITRNEATSYFLALRQAQPVSSGSIGTLRYVSVLLALLSFGLCIVFSLIISRSLSKPVSQLSAAMRSLRKGDMEARVETNRTDELGQLSQSFNRMANELNEYMQRIVENQKEMDEAQIRLLQAQLNPHFLYNTLDTVKWLAKINNIPEIASITSNLAIILRQCVSGREKIPLREELDMIESYIDIQRIRFSGRFQYTVEVPDELQDAMIPKLILQPVVENAIIHGLADKESGYIYIYATYNESTMYVSITDDGCGMPPEEAERLNATSTEYREGHLGLHNVNHIIKMNYGKQYGLRFHSIVGVGTTITLELPIQRGKADA